MKNKTYLLALSAVMFAVILVAMLLDRAISLALPVSMALLTLLVTFSYMLVDNKWHTAFLAGTFMGLASLFKVFVFPSVTSVYNLNPLVSILPRMLMAMVAYLCYNGMMKLTAKMVKEKARQYLCLMVAILAGLLVNTVCYLFALDTVKAMLGEAATGLDALIKGTLFFNIIPEYAVSLALAPTIILSLRKHLHISIKATEYTAISDEGDKEVEVIYDYEIEE